MAKNPIVFVLSNNVVGAEYSGESANFVLAGKYRKEADGTTLIELYGSAVKKGAAPAAHSPINISLKDGVPAIQSYTPLSEAECAEIYAAIGDLVAQITA